VTSVKRLFAFAVVAAAAVGLSSCGFTPLYAQPGVVSNMAAVDVVAPDGRIGFLVKESLDDAFARNRAVPPSYKMQLSVGEARYPRGVRIDNVASRYEYVVTTTYVLISLPSGAVAKRGSVHVEVTYDSADQPYASIAAQQDAQQRAATEAARRIQLEVAVWLANGKKH
jgi:LPS-assembly lipoprotein